MKNRNGFVSNSSSSSFIILIKDKELTEAQLVQASKEAYAEWQGTSAENLDEYYVGYCEEYAKDGNKILLVKSIEYGAEEGVEDMARELVNKLVGDDVEVSFAWEE